MDETPEARFDRLLNDERMVNAYARTGMLMFERQYEAERDLATLFALIPQCTPAQLATVDGH